MNCIVNEHETALIAYPTNVFYVTHLRNPDSFVVVRGDKKYYFTDEKYAETAEKKLPGFFLKNTSEIFDFLNTNNVKELGIEEKTLSKDFLTSIKENCDINLFYSIDSRLEKIRSIKSLEEISLIKKAQQITDKTFNDILPVIKEGISEIELASVLESLLYVNGADDLAFESIVAFGENTCFPHAERTDKKLINGSIITLDFGAKYHNYCSDMTRTIFFGQPDDEQLKIYKHVLTAQEMALSIAYSGISAKECDTMSRRYFSEIGLDKYFIHTLGHGVGLDIHEYPRLSQDSDVIMEEKMVVTFEPGLYFQGKFGVRIEDLVIFDKSGVINLTKSPKNIIII